MRPRLLLLSLILGAGLIALLYLYAVLPAVTASFIF